MLEHLRSIFGDYFPTERPLSQQNRSFGIASFMNQHRSIERYYEGQKDQWTKYMESFWESVRTLQPDSTYSRQIKEEFQSLIPNQKVIFLEMLYGSLKIVTFSQVTDKNGNTQQVSKFHNEKLQSFQHFVSLVWTTADAEFFKSELGNYGYTKSAEFCHLYHTLTAPPTPSTDLKVETMN